MNLMWVLVVTELLFVVGAWLALSLGRDILGAGIRRGDWFEIVFGAFLLLVFVGILVSIVALPATWEPA